jgi:hypothetical protein
MAQGCFLNSLDANTHDGRSNLLRVFDKSAQINEQVSDMGCLLPSVW